MRFTCDDNQSMIPVKWLRLRGVEDTRQMLKPTDDHLLVGTSVFAQVGGGGVPACGVSGVCDSTLAGRDPAGVCFCVGGCVCV